jgi:alcohol dehydrogenase
MESQSLLLMGPRMLAWVTEQLPPLAPDAVLVRTTAGAVSVGTELPQYTGAARSPAPRGYPRMTGYESVGVVVACGGAVHDVHPGDRVVAFYGHRTLAVVPDSKVIPVPDGISDALALLAILTCDVAKGIRTQAPREDEPVLVTGAGAIGLLTIWVLRAYGVRAVDVVEPVAERRALALALRLGARQAWTPEDVPSAESYTVGFECSSRDAAFHLLQRRVAAGGRICVLADGNIEPLTLAPDFHRKELTVVGSSDGWDYQEHARWYFARVQAGAPELEAIFDDRVAASALPEAFARMASGERMPVKVLIDYNTG